MKFTIERNTLLSKLNLVSHALPVKTPMPILTGIKIEVYEEGMVFTSSNSDISIRTMLDSNNVKVEETGTVVIPGKTLCDIIRSLNAKEVSLEVNEKSLFITADRGHYKLNIMDSTLYPNINFDLGEENLIPIILNANDFSNMVNSVIFSTAQNEKKPILTGVNFKHDETNKNLTVVATDSFRLSRFEKPLENVADFNVTIPNSGLYELLKSVSANEELKLFMVGNLARFSFGETDFVTRMLDSAYPETSRLIGSEFESEVEIDRNELINAVDRITVLSSNGEKDKEITYNVIGLTQLTENTAMINSNSRTVGEAKEEITIKVLKGATPTDIKFSGKYFVDALKSFKSEKVVLKFNGTLKPFIICSETDLGLIQLILPVRAE